ncbi:hypothetical protein PPEP_a0901 [Pseudoalteromonas peptidolytica F12-50-A1]|uniref:Uncharacterized protein n=1 Tax=Pseudoalteromonas peptidolytica F12-50-A1 TaxID=1315280 RepID=A0A8I0MU60_9GAMM|nr:hypothetical protein [Pseudoalteromonas peptidolytica F12-50-A1]
MQHIEQAGVDLTIVLFGTKRLQRSCFFDMNRFFLLRFCI